MKIFTDSPAGSTVVQNIFIDYYMPKANGEFVKVYLYLLRCADTDRELTLSSIADALEHTENDIKRALIYWERQQLMRIQLMPDGVIHSVLFLTLHPDHSKQSENGAAESKKPDGDRRISEAPTKERIMAVREQKEMKQLFFIAEQYLQRPLTSSEQSDFIYYYDTLQFSADLIEYLLEYCISKGSPSRHYIRKVALSWADEGISTVMQAKQESNLYNKNYFTIFNAFGIKGRNPVASELEIMGSWLREFSFSMDIILEACRRTVAQIHQPSFQYADKILRQWHKKGVKTLADINKLDLQRKKEQGKAQAAPARAQSNRFNNFTQRDYDYAQLEKQLLNQ